MKKWRVLPVSLALTALWGVCAASSEIESLLGRPGQDGVRIIAVVFFATVILSMATEHERWPIWKRIGFLPAAFFAHVVFTVPASAALGVLMYSPDHVRSIGEQRAVFILAALPILVVAMRQSRLFTREVPVAGTDREG